MVGRPKSRAEEGDDDYKVGYGKPPRHTRFKPGQSGNAKGRPRGQRNIRTVVTELLEERIKIREGDKARTVSMLDAILRLTINNALKGDSKSLSNFFALLRQIGLLDDEPDALRSEQGNAEDETILADFLERQLNSAALSTDADLADDVPEADTNANPAKSK
jgi:Family of unknown function (DUF5681)